MAGFTRSLSTPLAVQLLVTCCTVQLTLLWSKPAALCLPANKTAYALLPIVNAEGPYLGLVIPNTYELYPFLEPDVFEPSATVPNVDLGGRRFYVGTIDGQKIIAVMCGLAMLNAGITTQQLLDFFDISGVLHYGIAGGANDSLHIGDVSIPKYWAHTGLWNWQAVPGRSMYIYNVSQVVHIGCELVKPERELFPTSAATWGNRNEMSGFASASIIRTVYMLGYSNCATDPAIDPNIINRMQRYGDGLTTPLSLESDGDFTRAYGALQIGKYNVPSTNKPANASLLNNVWYQPEEVFAVTGTPEVRAHAFFVKVDEFYYGLAKQLSGITLESCANGTCLNYSPKVTVGLRGGAQNVFVDNAAYRSFIFDKFKISTVDMESSAVALVCLTNNVPFIAIRSISDLAGGTSDPNQAATFSNLAASNAVLVLRSFIKLL